MDLIDQHEILHKMMYDIVHESMNMTTLYNIDTRPWAWWMLYYAESKTVTCHNNVK